VLHVHALSLLISTVCALLVGVGAGVYAALVFWRYHISDARHARKLIGILHANAHKTALSCPCCDTLQISEEAARRELEARGIKVDAFLARARRRREKHFGGEA
jgi:hypothetical protein